MKKIDNILENLQKEVEIHGRSGSDRIFIDNLQFSISPEDYDTPSVVDEEAGIGDVAWFFSCARKGIILPCPNPDRSFWVKHFGNDAIPYGPGWNISRLIDNLMTDGKERRAVLCNGSFGDTPPCILSYQFQNLDYNSLDLTVYMRSSDVANVLPQDVFMSGIILENIASSVNLEVGKMTFVLANAHVKYRDSIYSEEFSIDTGY